MKPDREILREKWRVAEAEADAKDDEYQRAKEGKQIFLDGLIGELIAAEPGMKQATAERLARTSDKYRDELKRVHDLRRELSALKLAAKDADRAYWEQVAADARDRAEMRMTGYAR